MRCETCEKDHVPHRVFMATPVVRPGRQVSYFDEADHYHRHDSDVTVTLIRCSNGHSWTHEGRNVCPSCQKPVDPGVDLDPQNNG